MTNHRDPFRALAILAGVCAVVLALPPVVRADEFPSTFHFSFFDAPKKAVHRHYAKKVAPAAPVVAPASLPEVTTSVPPAATVAAPSPADAVTTVKVQTLPGPTVSKNDVEELKKADPVAEPEGLLSAPISTATGTVTAVASVANVGVNAVHAATGGGWKFVLAMVLIIAGAIGGLRLAAVKLKGVYVPAWNFVWGWLKWAYQLSWWLVKLGASYVWGLIKTAYGNVLLRFETWRASAATPPAAVAPKAPSVPASA